MSSPNSLPICPECNKVEWGGHYHQLEDGSLIGRAPVDYIPATDLERLREALSLARSMILSREPMSVEAEHVIDAALSHARDLLAGGSDG